MIEYGHTFPDGTPWATVHLWCYKNHNPEVMLSRAQHFEFAIRNIWPEKMPTGDKGYIWSDWAHRRLDSWVNNEYQTWWGPSSSGKSTDAGIFALTEWLAAPNRTTITVCSTTKDMLERRIWREIVRFHSMQQGILPGERRKQPPQINYVDPNDPAGENTINAIFAVAVQKGTTAEAVGNMVGMHNDYNILIIDEMQATRQAAVEAYDNLSTGLESKFLGMGNPVSRMDPLGRASEPVGGWNSVSTSDMEWKTKRGVTLYFDGLLSPAIKEPKKYFFLLNKKQIDMMAKDPGRDSPRFWSQRRGFVPPEGLTQTVLTESFINKFKMAEGALWIDGYKTIAGLDPSFSAGGDACVLYPARVGRMTDGLFGIEYQKEVHMELKLSDSEPMTFRIARDVIQYCKDNGIDIGYLGVDTSGQQSSIADVIDRLSKEECHRVHFASEPGSQPVSIEDARPAKDAYRDKMTEMWYQVREFGRNGQVRGLGNQAAEEFCQRVVSEKVDVRGRIILESKTEMKARTGGKSPDDADAASICIEVMRNVMGIFPGQGGRISTGSFSTKDVQKNMLSDEDVSIYEEDATQEELTSDTIEESVVIHY
jgi:hypothetical protein